MNAVNRTLYIPLYAKAYVSRRGLFLSDKKAEAIWEKEGFPLRGRSRSKWLAFYLGIRAAVFDAWLKEQAEKEKDAVIVHIGCGLDSRVLRCACGERRWYDVDLPEVIRERKQHYEENGFYRMLSGDARKTDWLDGIPEGGFAIVLLEGLSMYLTAAERKRLMEGLCGKFEGLALLTDCYSDLAAKMSKYKNPVKELGVEKVYGMDDPRALEGNGLRFLKEHSMTPPQFIRDLSGMERAVFQKLYAGRTAKKLYRLFEYGKERAGN